MARRLSRQLDDLRENIRPMQSFLAGLRNFNPGDDDIERALAGLSQARKAVESLMLRADKQGC